MLIPPPASLGGLGKQLTTSSAKTVKLIQMHFVRLLGTTLGERFNCDLRINLADKF